MAAERSGVVLDVEKSLINELPDAPVVIDVGANVGEFTAAVLAARPPAWVLAIEPQASAFDHLRREFGANERVLLVNGAVGGRRERRTLFSDSPDSYLATFHPRSHMPMIQTSPVGEVEVWPLASLTENAFASRIDLLKIDTEGHELAVLEGALPILRRVQLVLFEHFEDETRYTNSTIEDFRRLLADFTVAPLIDASNKPTHMWVAKKGSTA